MSDTINISRSLKTASTPEHFKAIADEVDRMFVDGKISQQEYAKLLAEIEREKKEKEDKKSSSNSGEKKSGKEDLADHVKKAKPDENIQISKLGYFLDLFGGFLIGGKTSEEERKKMVEALKLFSELFPKNKDLGDNIEDVSSALRNNKWQEEDVEKFKKILDFTKEQIPTQELEKAYPKPKVKSPEVSKLLETNKGGPVPRRLN